ncbi:Prephenate dehydratase OS=Streptomyces albaduncus OX=68172 GN=FHS32_004512 PE=4 SV=1 [Streptomyces griseoloalbus]
MPASRAYPALREPSRTSLCARFPSRLPRRAILYVSVQSALDAVRAGEAEAARPHRELGARAGSPRPRRAGRGHPADDRRRGAVSITFAVCPPGHQGCRTSDGDRPPGRLAAGAQLAAHAVLIPTRSGSRLLERGRRAAGPGGRTTPVRREFAAAGYGLEALQTGIHDARTPRHPARAGGSARAACGADRGGQTSVVLWQRDDRRAVCATCWGSSATAGHQPDAAASPAPAAASATPALRTDAEGHISDAGWRRP